MRIWHTVAAPDNAGKLRTRYGTPEPNPTEQVWQQSCDRSLANRCYDSHEQIVDVCRDAWNAFTQIPGAIRSLYTRTWDIPGVADGKL